MDKPKCARCGRRIRLCNKSGLCRHHYDLSLRERTEARNRQLMDDMRNGVGLDELCAWYGITRKTIDHIVSEQSPKRPRPVANVLISAPVMRRAADLVKARPEQLRLTWRDREMVRTRMACMLVMHERGMSIAAISRSLARDHSTICYGLRVAARYERSEPDFARMVEQVRAA